MCTHGTEFSMATSKPEVLTTQAENKIETRSRRLHLGFRGRPEEWNMSELEHDMGLMKTCPNTKKWIWWNVWNCAFLNNAEQISVIGLAHHMNLLANKNYQKRNFLPKKHKHEKLFNCAQNALKLTYSNLQFQKFSGGETPGPPLHGEGRV